MVDRPAARVAEARPRRTEVGNWKRAAPPLLAHGGHHTMTVLPTGAVLVVGGEHAKWEREPASAEVWDPMLDRWDLVPGIDARPTAHTATLLPDGRVAVAGGTGPGSDGRCLGLTVYSPRTGHFDRARPLPTPRVQHAAVVLSDGRLLLAGGFGCDAKGNVVAVPISVIDVWDPKQEAWTVAGQLPAGQAATTAYRLPDGRVLLLAERKRNTCLWSPKPDGGGACENGPALDGRYHGGAQLADGTVVAFVDGESSSKLVEVLEGDRWVPRTTDSELRLMGSAMGAVRLADDRLFMPNVVVDVRKQAVAWGRPLPWRMLGIEAAALRTGGVLLVGGSRPNDGSRALLWDPAGQPTGNFTSLPAGPDNDWELVAPLRDGRLLFRKRNHPARGPNRVTVWDPRSGRETETAPTHDYRALFTSVVTGQGDVIVIGGEDLNRERPRRLLGPRRSEPDPSTLSSVERWSPATGQWTQLAPLPEPRESADAVLLADGRILVAGGAHTMFESGPEGVYQGVSHVTGDVFVYEPSRNTWRRGPSLGRTGAHLLVLSDGRVLGIGAVCGTIGRALERWEPTACPAESHAGAAALEDGRVLVVGGEGKAQDIPSDSAELWDPKTGSWRRVHPMTVGRYNATVVALPGGGALVAGGETQGIEVWDAAQDRWRLNTELDGAPRSLVKTTDGVLVDVRGAGDARLWLWRENRL
jgi:large repetitive protein